MNLSRTISRIRNRYRRTLSIHFGRRFVEVRPESPIVSFVFDDFPRSALLEGGSILQQYGVCGTYYVSLGLMGRELPCGPGFLSKDLEHALTAGHELGCHTFAHCHSWDTKPRVFEQSIIENKRVLQGLIPGATFKTLSYPIAHPRPGTKRSAGRHFVCCRGEGGSYNIGATDANNLQACFLEKNKENPEALKRLVDENSRSRGWLIFATHDIAETPTLFGCRPAFFDDIVRYVVASGTRVLPVANAWEETTGA